jgi:hypothetical protein
MDGHPKKLCAIDFSYLLLLEANKTECVEAFQGLERRKYEFILTESPLQEMQEMAAAPTAPEFAEFATVALRKLRAHYGIQTPGLQPVHRGCADIVASILLDKVLPKGISRNRALTIVEASLHECACIMTVDPLLSKSDGNRVNSLLVEKDCNPIWIFNPELTPLEKD